MKLHRAGQQPDWALLASDRRNGWQRVAAATGGYVTPANALSLLGLCLVIVGLNRGLAGHPAWMVILLVAGRILDLLDGLVAEITGTKGPVGERFDAVADKIGTFLTIIILGVLHTVAWWLLVVVAAPQIMIAILSSLAQVRSVELHPSRWGKLSMAVAWVGLVIAILSHPLGAIILIVAAVMSLYAAYEYMREALKRL